MVRKLLILILVLVCLLNIRTIAEASNFAPLGYILSNGRVVSSPTGLVPAYSTQCTITYTNDTFIGNANQTCGAGHECRPVPGSGNLCVEAPANGSVPDDTFCFTDKECTSGYCFHTPGVIGSSVCKTKCGPATCSGGCIVTTDYKTIQDNAGNYYNYPQDTNQCVLPTATPTSPPAPCNEGSQCSTGYCDTTTHTCKTAPTATPTATCASNGIKSLTYDKNGCFNSFQQAKSATVTCNDGTVKTFTSSFGCTDTFQFQSSILNFCSSHKTCPLPTPTNTPTPTPSPRPQETNTPTPRVLTCDPDPTGTSANKIDNADFELWKKEYSHQVDSTKTDCFVHDNKVDLLDFQVWKDIYVTHKKQEF